MTEHLTKIIHRLTNLGIPVSLLTNYSEPHRFYHNLDHISSMCEEANRRGVLTDELLLSIFFHDIIYDPKATDNEEKSAELYRDISGHSFNSTIFQAILDTKTHKATSELSANLCDLDLQVLYGGFMDFMDFENKIFKEYQWVDLTIYKKERIKILANLGVRADYLDYIENRKVSIGIYTGSFNPFHVGHYSILQKAETIFDKVIIARGVNPDKVYSEYAAFPEVLKYRQTLMYGGLVTDAIKELGYDVTLIRSLRNDVDFKYELNQYRYLQELMPNIKVVTLFSDSKYEHISSSGIKILEKYNEGSKYKLN